ncbi:asparagine synthase-related protein [Parerythrobacter lacustris]|uniref:asparagine synthase (glutamine-hydrolyzing) n=1 Tax=Parerythrobacter lacustris TaxID=2969984 RepID=A0ABT1XNF8_9SPHN|nr:asparagine synthase-related protein [Parerythrobacter lacustris]MCR2833194.1 asparagine synthase-related protein [Parerythrobacter lacustris]
MLSLANDCTDAELIGAAWRRWEREFADHLFGDFAIIIDDRATGLVHAVRDHIGACPLFYRLRKSQLEVSATIEPLIGEGECPEFDPSHLAAAVLGGHRAAAESTFYRDIRRLPPGHGLTVDRDGNCETYRWWKPRIGPPDRMPPIDALLEEGRELLARSVQDRLRSNAKIGFHLSGGLDSSAIVALAVPQLPAMGSSAIGFAWQGLGEGGESGRIRAAVDLAGIDFVVSPVDAERIAHLLRQDWAKGPNQWNLLHEDAVQDAAAQRGIEAIFSGWGGDEAISFNGRGLQGEYLSKFRFAKLAALAGTRNLRSIGRVFREGLDQLNAQPTPDGLAVSSTYLSADFLASVTLPPKRSVDLRSVHSAVETLHGLGSVSARVEDWALSGRAKGIDYLYPLLDRRLMEFAYRLPAEVFRKGPVKRWFFREMTRGLLPESIRTDPSKHEPLRTGDLALKLSAALRILGEEVEARASAMKRAEYFDMDALVADLKNPPQFGDPRLGHLRRAVQFLDF